ncbi:MAG: DUF2226 domain-containing protein [Archaeoglobaceae archaeon]
MILPKVSLTKIERGRFTKILEDLKANNFSGYLKVGFKRDELSVGEILLDSGKVNAVEVLKLKSKTSVSGKIAFAELLAIDSGVVEIYALSPEQVKRSLEMNKAAVVSEEEILRLEKEKLIKKYGITPPKEEEITEAVKEAIGNSELVLELERDKVLEKYGIKKPSEEEIDYIISNALAVEEAKPMDFEALKGEIIQILEKEIGKPAKRAIEILKSCKTPSELENSIPELGRSLRSLIVFLSRSKIDAVISKIEEKIGKKIT